MAETAVKQVQAQIYVAQGGNWAPKTAGIANITLYHNAGGHTYRIVGLDGSNAALNSPLSAGLQYSESSPTFHMWTDAQQQTFGLNFADGGAAAQFSAEVKRAIQALSSPPPSTGGGGGGAPPPPPPPPSDSGPPPSSGSSGAPLTLAEQIALKKQKGLNKTVTVEKNGDSPSSGGDAPPPKPSGGGGGGNLMGDLLGALQRRKSPAANTGGGEVKPPPQKEAPSAPVKSFAPAKKGPPAKSPPVKAQAPSSPSPPPPSSSDSAAPQDLVELKEQIMIGVRAELERIKQEIIAAINNKN